MKIVEAGFEIIDTLDGIDILKKIELCGRVCYKSEDKITDESCKTFVQNLIRRGHESVLEHVSFSVRFICDRGISHELVRHRIASFSQESTRYCNYGNDPDGIGFIKPSNLRRGTFEFTFWRDSCRDAEEYYKELLKRGCSPQQARSVLPNSLKTELIVTTNLREWRHILDLRCSPAAHPDMRELMIPLLDELHNKIPFVFDDIYVKHCTGVNDI